MDGSDLALIRLNRTSIHKKATLPKRNEILLDGELLTAIGLGEQVPDQRFKECLQQNTNVQVLKNEYCNAPNVWVGLIQDSMFCSISFVPGFGPTCKGEPTQLSYTIT